MRRAFLNSVCVLFVLACGFTSAGAADPDPTVVIDQDGTLLITNTAPPPGLVDPAVAVNEDGTLAVSSVTPPSGLVNPSVVIDQSGSLLVSSVTPPYSGLVDPSVVIDQNGALAVTNVTPPPGLVNPTVIINEAGTYLGGGLIVLALTREGMAILIVLLVMLGGYVLARRRVIQAS